MAKQLKEIEIPLGAKDSELCGWEYTIPEGMEVTIVDNKIVVKKKESEDDTMRKMAIKAIYAPEAQCCIKSWGIEPDDVVAWIAKQGKQKPVLDNALKEAFDKSRKDYSLEEKKEASDYSESILPTSIACGESEGEYMLHKIIEAAYITGKNSMQNPAWSEEDEAIYYGVIETEQYMLDVVNGIKKFDVGNISIKKECTRELNWLKSLKERVQPQPKQEWSEEDKRKINRIYSILRQAADTHAFSTSCRLIGDKECVELQDFLKSITLQNTWKPSEEQMEALKHYVDTTMDGEMDLLYQDLKKLRKE